MMKYLIAFLLLLSFSAGAQTPPRPACYPLVNGYPVGVPVLLSGQVGQHLFWLCSDSKGAAPKAEGISWPHAATNPQIISSAITSVTRASAKVGTANALWDQHVSFNCPDVEKETTARGRLCKERRAFLDANKTAWGVK